MTPRDTAENHERWAQEQADRIASNFSGSGVSYDWDNATVRVRVPVHYTAGGDVQEVELPLGTFARLLLTSVPEEWFAQPPVSDDLPLHVTFPPLPI